MSGWDSPAPLRHGRRASGTTAADVPAASATDFPAASATDIPSTPTTTGSAGTPTFQRS